MATVKQTASKNVPNSPSANDVEGFKNIVQKGRPHSAAEMGYNIDAGEDKAFKDTGSEASDSDWP